VSEGSGCFSTGLSVFDELFGEFRPGRLHLLVGHTELNFHLLDRIGVLSAESGDNVYYVDGTHRINPFSMASILRARRIDPTPTLRRIKIARAFTAHQMDALVRGSAPEADPFPDLLLVSAMDHLLSDPEVDEEEGQGMLENCLRTVEGMARQGSCVVLAALGDGRGSDLLQRMVGNVWKWASLKRRGGGRIKIINQDGRWVDFRPLPPTQTSLDDFGG